MNIFRTTETRETLSSKSGVYKISLRGQPLCYIGQSLNLFNRMRSHVREAYSRSKKSKPAISRAIEQYGPDAFDFVVLCFCDSSSLIELETHYIGVFNSTEFGYNVHRVGRPPKSISPSQETREKNRQAIIGRKRTPETIERMRESALRKPPMSAEARAKASESHKGCCPTEATREKHRQARLGKPLPADVRAKITAKNLLRSKPVNQYSKLGQLIATHPSVSEAARTVPNAHVSNLTGALQGRLKTHAGFVWRYVETGSN